MYGTHIRYKDHPYSLVAYFKKSADDKLELRCIGMRRVASEREKSKYKPHFIEFDPLFDDDMDISMSPSQGGGSPFVPSDEELDAMETLLPKEGAHVGRTPSQQRIEGQLRAQFQPRRQQQLPLTFPSGGMGRPSSSAVDPVNAPSATEDDPMEIDDAFAPELGWTEEHPIDLVAPAHSASPTQAVNPQDKARQDDAVYASADCMRMIRKVVGGQNIGQYLSTLRLSDEGKLKDMIEKHASVRYKKNAEMKSKFLAESTTTLDTWLGYRKDMPNGDDCPWLFISQDNLQMSEVEIDFRIKRQRPTQQPSSAVEPTTTNAPAFVFSDEEVASLKARGIDLIKLDVAKLVAPPLCMTKEEVMDIAKSARDNLPFNALVTYGETLFNPNAPIRLTPKEAKAIAKMAYGGVSLKVLAVHGETLIGPHGPIPLTPEEAKDIANVTKGGVTLNALIKQRETLLKLATREARIDYVNSNCSGPNLF